MLDQALAYIGGHRTAFIALVAVLLLGLLARRR
jgi:hypothetical protein